MRTQKQVFEAARLTRAGKLKEAMAALMLASPNSPSEDVSRSPISDSIRGLFERIAGQPINRTAAATPKRGNFNEYQFSNDAGQRRYKLFIPSCYHGQALPLIVMLHGCTQSPDDFAAGTRMNELAEESGFFVAYPEQSRGANISKCWNWFNTADQQRDTGEPSLIAGIAREIMRNFKVKPERVYVAGLSAGGAAAAIMAATYPELFAAAGVHSGLACGAASNMANAGAAMRRGGDAVGVEKRRNAVLVPTIVFHGDKDNTVNPVNAEYVIDQAKADKTLTCDIDEGAVPDGTRFTRTILKDAAGRDVLEQWILHGAGHSWSGGSNAGSFTDARGPDASREMIRFFFQHASAKKDL